MIATTQTTSAHARTHAHRSNRWTYCIWVIETIRTLLLSFLTYFPFSQIVLLHRAYLTLLKGQKAKKKTQRSYFLNSVYVNAVKTTRIGLSNNFNKLKSKIREWLWVVEMEEVNRREVYWKQKKVRVPYFCVHCTASNTNQLTCVRSSDCIEIHAN